MGCPCAKRVERHHSETERGSSTVPAAPRPGGCASPVERPVDGCGAGDGDDDWRGGSRGYWGRTWRSAFGRQRTTSRSVHTNADNEKSCSHDQNTRDALSMTHLRTFPRLQGRRGRPDHGWGTGRGRRGERHAVTLRGRSVGGGGGPRRRERPAVERDLDVRQRPTRLRAHPGDTLERVAELARDDLAGGEAGAASTRLHAAQRERHPGLDSLLQEGGGGHRSTSNHQQLRRGRSFFQTPSMPLLPEVLNS